MITKTKMILASSMSKGMTGIGLLEVVHQADFPNLADIEGAVKIIFQVIIGGVYLWTAWKKRNQKSTDSE